MARLKAKMTGTSKHRVIDKLSSKKINYVVTVSCAVKKTTKQHENCKEIG